jgi:hypothetical protein
MTAVIPASSHPPLPSAHHKRDWLKNELNLPYVVVAFRVE